MAVNAPNPGIFYGNITAAVVALRNDFQTILNINAYVTAMGGVTFLQAAPFSLGTGDADALVACLGNLAELAAIYSGGTPGGALNYAANSEPFWSGT